MEQYVKPAAEVERVIQKTCDFLAKPSVVGYEGAFLGHLQSEFLQLGWQCDLAPRHLLVQAPVLESEVLLTVHVDRHGLITTAECELEYAAFVLRAEKYLQFPSATLGMLQKIRSRFIGTEVDAYDPQNGQILGRAVISEAFYCPHRENMIFLAPDLGALPPYTPASYGASWERYADRFSGQLDNAISVALAYELCKAGFAGRVLFTCEEEIGRSWQAIQALLERGRFDSVKLIALDTSPFEADRNRDLDFIILRNRDAHSLFDPDLTAELKSCAERHGIPYVFKDRWLEKQPREKPQIAYGSTELGRLIKETSGRWNGTTLQIPTVDYHTNRETVSVGAIDRLWRFLTHLVELKSGA